MSPRRGLLPHRRTLVSIIALCENFPACPCVPRAGGGDLPEGGTTVVMPICPVISQLGPSQGQWKV